MPLMRWLSVILLSFFITACGGGGTLEKDGGTIDDGTTADPIYTLSVQGYVKASDETINAVTEADPIDIKITLLKNNEPASGQRITFTLADNIGAVNLNSALTNSEGIATVELSAGLQAGAGEITATYTGNDINVNSSFAFTSTGGQGESNQGAFTLSLKGLSQLTAEPTNTVTTLNSLDLQATLKQQGEPLSNVRITFNLADNIGEITPSSGTALTNNLGIATVELSAGDVIGAGEATATYTHNGETITSQPFSFETLIDASASADLVVTLLSSDNTATRNVTFSEPSVAQAKLLLNQQPAAFKLIQFNVSGFGILNPSNGTAMTNSEGIAKLDLLTGSEAGAGNISASYLSESQQVINSNAYTYTAAGDAPVQGVSEDFNVNLSLTSSVNLSDTNEINAQQSGIIKARVTDSNGDPVVNRVVSFTSTLGSLLPSSGTALTNQDGVATLNITTGTIEGAGLITAQYEAVESSIGFYTRGDAIDPNQNNADIAFKILINCQSDFRTTRDPNLCEETTSISGEDAAIVFIELTKQGSTTPLAQTLVTATTTIGAISPSTGTAISNENGIALLDLVPGRDVGAGEITVTVLQSSIKKAFQISAVDVDVSINSSLAESEVLSAGSTALISVNLSKNGETFVSPLSVEFTSGCVDAGLAVIDASVTSIGGVARSTYRAQGCVGADLITATVITGGNTVSASTVVNVSAANVGSLEFLDVSEPVIALKGTGGANRKETSVVRFRLIDENGNVLPARTVNFKLATEVGGLKLGQLSGFTDADGVVQTVVQSGVVPTPVKVIASSEQNVDGENVIVTAPSDVLVVSTGIADQNSFSLSRSQFNVHGLNIDGTEVDVNVRLADHFNNPVPDGTAVSFITEGGVIEPSCTTSNGGCSVKWRSSNPRPFAEFIVEGGITRSFYGNTIADKCDSGLPCPLGIKNNDNTAFDLPLGGRATVLAYAIGEETFSDLNGNGYFDEEDFFDDLFDKPEAFIDNNEDGTFGGKNCETAAELCSAANSAGDEFEEFIDFDGNAQWTQQNGLYNGLLCRPEDDAAGICTREMINVFQNQEIVMSSDNAHFRLVTYADECTDVQGVTATEVHVNSDINSNLVRKVQNDLTSQKMCQITEVDLTSATGQESINLTVFIADIFNNPLPVGTGVTILTDNGVLSGEPENYAFPNTTSRVPVSLSFALGREPADNRNDITSGFLEIKTTAPSGLVSSLSVSVRDDPKVP